MAEREFPRVLLISHNALSRSGNNGKTLASFFSGWRRDALAQMYITSEAPDGTNCDRYFRISDAQLLKACLRRGFRPGETVAVSADAPPPQAAGAIRNKALRRWAERKPPLIALARDVLWRSGKWKTPAFTAWADAFAPQAVFMQCSNIPAVYDVAFWVCERYRIPLFIEITDDYTSPRFSLDPLFWLYLCRIRQKMAKAIALAERTVVIGEKMEREYARRFGGAYYIAMNSVPARPCVPPPAHEGLRIVFTGNLALGRWETVARLGEICGADEKLRDKVSLLIYSATELEPSAVKRLNEGVLRFCGSAPAQEIRDIQQSADVLLHVESFRRKDRYVTRYSVSTKIAEYLACGRCVLAVGPVDVASIEYIRDYGLGAVLTSLDDGKVRECLHRLLDDPAYRLACGERGYRRAVEYHNIETVQNDVRAMISLSVSG